MYNVLLIITDTLGRSALFRWEFTRRVKRSPYTHTWIFLSMLSLVQY